MQLFMSVMTATITVIYVWLIVRNDCIKRVRPFLIGGCGLVAAIFIGVFIEAVAGTILRLVGALALVLALDGVLLACYGDAVPIKLPCCLMGPGEEGPCAPAEEKPAEQPTPSGEEA